MVMAMILLATGLIVTNYLKYRDICNFLTNLRTAVKARARH